MEREGASRRDVVRGMAAGVAGVCLQPIMAFGSMTPQVGRSLPRATPETAGISPAAIAAFVDAVNEKVGGLHSMMLLRHGKVAAEAWWKPFRPEHPHILYSLSKSFTSTAVGFAVHEGKLSVDDRVVSFFPDKLPETVSENLAAMKVRDLLTMSTGHETEPPVGGTDDWPKTFLAAPVPHKPGTHFLYNTPATHMLAAIVTKVTGQRMLDYLTTRLFTPLAIEGMTWDQSPGGVDIGGYGLKLKTEDIAKFGQLLLQKGKWNDKQVVPADWIAEATKKQVSNGDPAQNHDWCQGYGYQFWMCRHGNFRGDGAFGQYCVVMPDQDAVLAINSGVGDMGAVLQAAWDHLLPGMEKPEKGGEAALREKLAGVGVPPPKGEETSPLASEISGKTWAIDANPEGVTSMKITFEGDRGVIETVTAKETVRQPFGFGEWVEGEKLATARAAWAKPDQLDVKVCFLDSPHEWSGSYLFDGEKVTVKRSVNVTFGPREMPDLHGSRKA